MMHQKRQMMTQRLQFCIMPGAIPRQSRAFSSVLLALWVQQSLLLHLPLKDLKMLRLLMPEVSLILVTTSLLVFYVAHNLCMPRWKLLVTQESVHSSQRSGVNYECGVFRLAEDLCI